MLCANCDVFDQFFVGCAAESFKLRQVNWEQITLLSLPMIVADSWEHYLQLLDSSQRDLWLLQTPLHLAVVTGQVEIVQSLLEFGASPNCPDRKGLNCLHLAVSYGHVDCLRLLLTSSKITVDLNALNYEGIFHLLHRHTRAINSWRKTATTPSEYITVQGVGSGLLVVKALT